MTPSKSSRRDLQSGNGPGAARVQQQNEKNKNTSWNISVHCFGTILKSWRFPELLMTPSESSRRDLQSGNGPGASGAQKKMKTYEI